MDKKGPKQGQKDVCVEDTQSQSVRLSVNYYK